MTYTFRIDDVSMNTDQPKLDKMLNFLRGLPNTHGGHHVNGISQVRILLAVSVASHDLSKWVGKNGRGLNREMIHPPILEAYSDYRNYYKIDYIGVPQIIQKIGADIQIASHGLVHVDHRLLSREAQELSIVTSCSLLKAEVFVPPFNKWNKDTDDVCREHGIKLVKFEEGWKHLGFHPFSPEFHNYYFHSHDFTFKDFTKRFVQKNHRRTTLERK